VAGKGIAGKLLAEILHHVIALGLAVHQHIQADGFLSFHRLGDGLTHGRFVGRLVDALRLVIRPRLANFGRLWEGTDGGCGQQGQLQPFPLGRCTLGIGVGAQRHGRVDALHACLDLGPVNTWRAGAGDSRRPTGFDLSGNGVASRFQAALEDRQFIQLLPGKGQPAAQFGIQAVFQCQVLGYMQQRAGGREPQPLAQALIERFEARQQRLQLAAPDVASVHDTQRQHLVGRQSVDKRAYLGTATHGVDVQAIHRQVAGQRQIVAQLAEIDGQQLAHRRTCQLGICAFKSRLPCGREVQRQDRLVDLHPLGTHRCELFQPLSIDRDQFSQQLQRIERHRPGLAQPQIAQWPQQHRASGNPLITSLGECLGESVRLEGKALPDGKFRDQVVVVGVEPLGHLAGGRMGISTGHAKQQAKIAGLGPGAKAGGNHAECQRSVQHMIVKSEISHRHPIQSGSLLHLPVLGAQDLGLGFQGLCVDFASPMTLQGEFQFALGAHTGKTEIVQGDHG